MRIQERVEYKRTRAGYRCEYVLIDVPLEQRHYCNEKALWKKVLSVSIAPTYLCTAHKKEVVGFADYNK